MLITVEFGEALRTFFKLVESLLLESEEDKKKSKF
jgi:hypothetical protein